MKKLLKVALAFAMVAGLTACGEKTTAYAKVGLGVVSTFNEETNQVNSTIAVVGLDADGKIQYLDLDVAQSTPTDAEPKTQTKEELGDAYGMAAVSQVGEWFEQAANLEEYCKGKTADEVAAIATKASEDGSHPSVPADEDLRAGTTMDIGSFKEAIAKACANAVDAAADKIGTGEVMAANAEKKQLNTTIAVVATDADGKIVKAIIDCAQIYPGVTDTKVELKDAYGMAAVSQVGEWYQQAANLETYIVGKTADEVAAIATKASEDGSHPSVPADEDLRAGTTMDIGSIKEALAEAMK